jgi:hypothetical protein
VGHSYIVYAPLLNGCTTLPAILGEIGDALRRIGYARTRQE